MCKTGSAGDKGAGRPRPTVLVIDDEPLLLGVLKRMLSYLGYDALGARSGQEGLEVYRQHMGRVDVVVLDALMPGMSGAECFKKLKELDPSVKVVVATGTAFEDSVAAMRKEGLVAVIEKPFGTEALGKVVQAALLAEKQRSGAQLTTDELSGLGMVAEEGEEKDTD
jgi:DNA-binding NtrC family response regulator